MKANAIYVLWLRDMKLFYRAKSRLIGTLFTPAFFLLSFGLGFRRMPVPNLPGISYVDFLVPGIVGMSLLFRSMIAGISLLWDREFGFLKEIMVAPVDRISIVLGRVAGGVSVSLLQGVILLLLSYLIGFRAPLLSILAAIPVMAVICVIFVGLGFAIASRMRDIQGFSLIMNFVMFPLFILSGALYPVENLGAIGLLSYISPLTYGVDALRGILVGVSAMPLAIDIAVISISALIAVLIGAYLFETGDSM